MKQFITNRKNQKIVLLVEISSNQKGLAFVMPGLGGFKEQDHIQTFADAFQEEGFTVVRFDTTNTLGSGESDGKYEDATTTNYVEDLEDVITWAKSQSWYEEPFWLCGHSLGGMSTILFAEKYPLKVKGLAPISTVVSGKISFDSPKYRGNNILKMWKESGWRIEESKSQPGLIKKLKWSHMEDRLKYDVLPNVKKLQMPVLLIVGDQDDSTPPEHQNMLFDHLHGEKEMHIIKQAPHTFRDKEQLKEIKKIIKQWIRKNQT
ncbi:MAG: alpha/beta fold hydrolase [Nanoarchaeota archaeon]